MLAIETHALTRSFGNRLAVDSLGLSVATGTVFGLLGPVGAGKTTTIRMLAGLIVPTSGQGRVLGYRLGLENTAIRRSVGIPVDTPGLYDLMSARQSLVFITRLYDVEAQKAEAQTERILRQLNLWERSDDKVGSFSKSMRWKLAVARALVHDPRILFLDEPTSGLDAEASRMVLDTIQQLKSEGRTIFLSTQKPAEAEILCDYVGVLRTRLLRVSTPEHLLANRFDREASLRTSAESGN